MNDLIAFHSGEIHTVDPGNSVSQALLVEEGRIVAVGTNHQILEGAPRARPFDLEGRALIPGIIDSHNHAWQAGRVLEGVFAFGLPSLQDLQEQVARRVAQLGPGMWVEGGGWIETQFRENRMPTRWDLDPVSPENPVVLDRIFSTSVANSRALEMAGIREDTPDPPEGKIQRNSSGQPTGILHRSAKLLVRRVMPGPMGIGDPPAVEESIRRAILEYRSWGITAIVEPGVTPQVARAYQNLLLRNQLGLRVQLMPSWHGFAEDRNSDCLDRYLDEIGIYTGLGNRWLSLGGLKMAIDGGLTSRTALISWPYPGDELPPEPPLRLDLSRLQEYVRKAHQRGWSVGIHVVGDISQEAAAEAIQRSRHETETSGRDQIIHGYYPTARALDLMAQAGTAVSVQPSFIYGEADGYPALLPPDKQKSYLPLRLYAERGIRTCISSDMPSAHYNPFLGLYSAVTRRGMRGHQLGSEECVDLPAALRMMTIDNAYLAGWEHEVGSLEPGKLADMAVLDRSLLQARPEDLRHIQVDATIIEGEFVFTRGKGSG